MTNAPALFFAWLTCWGQLEVPDSIPAELRQAWTERAGIKHLHAEVSSLYEDKERNTVRYQRRTVWLSEEKRRCDTIETKDGVTEREVCAFDGEKMYSWRDLGKPGVSFLGAIYPAGVSSGGFRQTIDIRPIGLVCQSVAGLPEKLKFPFQPANIESFETGDDMVDGRKAALWLAVLKDGRKFEYWFDKERQNSVVRVRVSSSQFAGGAEIAVVENQAVSGHLLPRTVVYKRTSNGQIVAEETTGIVVVSIDNEIKPSVFALEGFGLPWGIMVQDKAEAAAGAIDRGIKMWDGKALVPRPRQ